MHRFAMNYLLEWKKEENRKPLIIRGARQVGKSYLAKEFGRTFKYFAEINFESMPEFNSIFENNLNPEDIILKLSIALNSKIKPDDTLLFIDEIQACPRALTALRYFYEEMPQLHVIAAGSLIDFAIEEVGIPVFSIHKM